MMSDSTRTRLERSNTDAGATVATLTLDHPPLNLFDKAMFTAATADIADLTAEPPRAVLIRAEGRVVSGGVDVHDFDGLTAADGADLWRNGFAELAHRIEELPCPVVFSAHALTLTAAFRSRCAVTSSSPRRASGSAWWKPGSGSPRRWAARSDWPSAPDPAGPASS